MSSLPIAGFVRIQVRVNIRQGLASTSAPIAGKLDPGTVLSVVARVAGDEVQGNADWYRAATGGYVWSGACGPLEAAPVAAIAPDAPWGSPAVPTGAPSALAVPMVVDLSHYDMVTSFALARSRGVGGVIHKASQGVDMLDGSYRDRRQWALEAGLLWGAYHFGTGDPAGLQADHFLQCAQPDDRTLVALDFERYPSSQMTADGARQFLEQIEQRLGRRAVLYSDATIKDALGAEPNGFFGSHRLWLSEYGPAPHVQASWRTYWLWQYTDGSAGPEPRSAPGIPGVLDAQGGYRLDCNYYQGTPEQLAGEWAS